MEADADFGVDCVAVGITPSSSRIVTVDPTCALIVARHSARPVQCDKEERSALSALAARAGQCTDHPAQFFAVDHAAWDNHPSSGAAMATRPCIDRLDESKGHGGVGYWLGRLTAREFPHWMRRYGHALLLSASGGQTASMRPGSISSASTILSNPRRRLSGAGRRRPVSSPTRSTPLWSSQARKR
jgi:hypothetical protein